MAKHADGVPPTTEWRQLGRYLWVGAGEYGCAGTIEHGRRFNAVDPNGTLVARCRALEDAQALLEELAVVQRDRPQASPFATAA